MLISCSLRQCWVAFVLVALFCSGLFAWTAQDPGTKPLTEEQVLSLVSSTKLGELPPGRVNELIRQRGIAFAVTDVFLLELQTREADPAVLETLRQIRGQGKDFVPTSPASGSRSSAASPTTEEPSTSASGNGVEARLAEVSRAGQGESNCLYR